MTATASVMTTNAEEFDLADYLADVHPVLLAAPEGRRALTEMDPLMFALVYLPHHLKSKDTGEITFADFHLDVIDQAKTWVVPVTGPRTSRNAYVAPRDTGKSTWLFLILPMWAAAHGHVKFVAAFADSSEQAEGHLDTFRRELQNNDLLRADFPHLLPITSRRAGATIDNRKQYTASGGFTFAARGIDSSSLGMKVGDQRPDLIILDDVEPEESNYTAYLAARRLSTIQDAILPLNEWARVCIVGTVTMSDSIIHQLVKSVRETDPPAQWIIDEKIITHYYAPIVTRDDGTERSIWPAKWPMEYLEERRHTRSYKKNFENDPLGADGDYWTAEDFVHDAELAATVTWAVLSVDPAVTDKRTSDFTGLAVIGWSPTARKFCVLDCIPVKQQPKQLRATALKLLVRHPSIRKILIETNQGGDTWKAIFHTMPVEVVTVHQSVKKEERARGLLNHYQRGRVIHAKHLPQLEGQMVAFPKAPHDDLVDAVGSGVAYVIRRLKPRKSGARGQSFSYL